MKFTQGSSFLNRQFGSRKKENPLAVDSIIKEEGNECQPPKQTKTHEVLATLPLTQSVVDAVRLFLHRLIQTLQILHEQCDHLPIHLYIRGAREREGYMSQDGPQNVPTPVPPSLWNEQSKQPPLVVCRVLSHPKISFESCSDPEAKKQQASLSRIEA